MTADEFAAWAEFYRLFPFDDLHRFHRPAAAVAASMGAKTDAVLGYLAPEPRPPGLSFADMQTMKALGMKKGRA